MQIAAQVNRVLCMEGSVLPLRLAEVSCRKTGWCCRTPQQLLQTVDLILQTYERSAGSASMLGQAGTLMNPEVISRMKDIQAAIQKDL